MVRALDGSLVPASCVDPEATEISEYDVSCNLKPLWNRLQQSMDDVLNGTTLYELAHASPGHNLTPSLEPGVGEKEPAAKGVYHI